MFTPGHLVEPSSRQFEQWPQWGREQAGKRWTFSHKEGAHFRQLSPLQPLITWNGTKTKGPGVKSCSARLALAAIVVFDARTRNFDYFDRSFRGVGGTTAALTTFNVIGTTGENEVNLTDDDGRDEWAGEMEEKRAWEGGRTNYPTESDGYSVRCSCVVITRNYSRLCIWWTDDVKKSAVVSMAAVVVVAVEWRRWWRWRRYKWRWLTFGHWRWTCWHTCFPHSRRSVIHYNDDDYLQGNFFPLHQEPYYISFGMKDMQICNLRPCKSCQFWLKTAAIGAHCNYQVHPVVVQLKSDVMQHHQQRKSAENFPRVP